MALSPSAFEFGVNGKLRITWGSTGPEVEEAGVTAFNNILPMEFGFSSGEGADADYCPSAGDSGDRARGKILPRRNARVSAYVSEHEVGFVPNNNLSGILTHFNPIVTAPSTRVGINTFTGGSDSNTVSTPTTIPFTSNYTGPNTDIELQNTAWGTPTRPLVTYTANKINFFFSGRRAARIAPGNPASGLGFVFVTIGGLGIAVTNIELINTANGTEVELTTGVAMQPTDDVKLSLNDGFFEIADTQSVPSNWNTASTVTNAEAANIECISVGTFVPPAFFAADLDPTQSGGTIGRVLNLFFTPAEAFVVDTSRLLSITLGTQGTHNFRYVSEGSQRVTYEPVNSSLFIYENEDVFGIVGSGLVGLTANPSITTPIFVININAEGDGAPAPTPTFVSGRVLANGTQVALFFNQDVAFASGGPSITAEYSPGASQNLTPTDTFFEGNPRAPVFMLTDATAPVRNFDTVTVVVPEGIVEGTQPSPQGNAAASATLENTSEVFFEPPVYQSSEINGNGNAILITFDIPIAIHPTFGEAVIENNLRVQARDESSGDTRDFIVDTEQDILIQSSDLVLFVRLTGSGLIFENTGGDGDDLVTFDTNGTAGLVVSQASTGPDEEDALALWEAIDPGEVVTNNSTQPEPAAAVTPTFVLARIDNIGANQYLSIRWDDGSSSSIQVQRSTALPTLVGALTGTITLEFESIQDGAGDNDEIRYLITGPQLKQDPDEGTITLDIPESVVVSNTTGTPNAETLDASPVNNNSNIPAPQPSQTPPIIQQIYIDTTGRILGVWYDVEIDAGPGSTGTLDCTQRGELALTRKAVNANDSTLLLFDINNTVFRGETAFASLVANVAVNAENSLQNAAVNNVEVVNNSLVPVPSPPIIDEVTLDNAGTTITATFNKGVEVGAGTAYIQSSLTGRHTVEITSINGAVATIDVAGIVFEEESTVTLVLEPDFVKESQFSFTSNERLEMAVDVSGRTSAAPDLPSIAKGLNLE